MQVKLTIPAGDVDEGTLTAALQSATAVAERQIPALPTIQDAIRVHGVRWRPEPPGQGYESFDHPKDVLARRWGDCDDLAPWLAAQHHVLGTDRGAQAFAVRSGPRKWHALVRRSNGRIEDPSEWAGMPKRREGSWQGAPVERPLHQRAGATWPAFDLRPIVVGEATAPGTLEYLRRFEALSPAPAFVCRIDAPCFNSRNGVSIRRAASTPQEAVRRALRTTAVLGGQFGTMDRDIVRRYAALSRVLDGRPLADVCGWYGVDQDEIGAFIPAILSAVGGALAAAGTGGAIAATMGAVLSALTAAIPIIKEAFSAGKGVDDALSNLGVGLETIAKAVGMPSEKLRAIFKQSGPKEAARVLREGLPFNMLPALEPQLKELEKIPWTPPPMIPGVKEALTPFEMWRAQEGGVIPGVRGEVEAPKGVRGDVEPLETQIVKKALLLETFRKLGNVHMVEALTKQLDDLKAKQAAQAAPPAAPAEEEEDLFKGGAAFEGPEVTAEKAQDVAREVLAQHGIDFTPQEEIKALTEATYRIAKGLSTLAPVFRGLSRAGRGLGAAMPAVDPLFAGGARFR